jgi:hypothetical protein
MMSELGHCENAEIEIPDRPLKDFQLKRPAFIQGDTYEKWKKETGLDIRTGSRTEGARPKEGGSWKNCKTFEKN